MSVKADVLFAVVPEWILYAEIGPQAVRLYAALARHADKDTGHAHPSRRRLSELLRCSPDTVDRALRELVAIGAISIEERHVEGTRERATNDYLVHVAPPRSRTDAATGGGTDAATGSRTGAAVNESQGNESQGNDISDVPARRTRQRDPVVDALAHVDGATDLTEVTPKRWRTLGVMAADLRKASPDVTPEEIARRAANWPTHFDATLTAPALVTHWPRLGQPGTNGARRRSDPAMELAQRAAATAAEEAARAAL